jgi:aldehyde dehydrogenase (NAD+)
VLYYLAENLQSREAEFIDRLVQSTNDSAKGAKKEFDLSLERLFTYAAYADKYDSHVHQTPYRNVTLAMKEPLGVLGIACPEEAPLLGFISTVIPAIAMGNTVVVIPSASAPLIATDLYQVFDTSDIPGGVINLVTGPPEELIDVLAKHDDVQGIWYFGTKEGSYKVQLAATENMKRTWVNFGKARDWFNPAHVAPETFLRKATEIKNIWVPYGE